MIRLIWVIGNAIVVLTASVIVAKSNAQEIPFFSINEMATVIVCSSAIIGSLNAVINYAEEIAEEEEE